MVPGESAARDAVPDPTDNNMIDNRQRFTLNSPASAANSGTALERAMEIDALKPAWRPYNQFSYDCIEIRPNGDWHREKFVPPNGTNAD